MRISLALCAWLFLASTPVAAEGLIKNPNGLLGLHWGMDQATAGNTLGLALACREAKPLTTCTGRIADGHNATATLLPNPGGGLLLQLDRNRLIGLVHEFSSPDPMAIASLLHNLMGAPTHRIDVPKDLDTRRARLFAWIRPRSVIELELTEVDDAEVPNVRVVLRAWSRKHYLKYHNVLARRVPRQ
jgi:hypothetical protein